jgi:hypothetical protein
MDSIGNILPNTLKRGGIGRKLREVEALEFFELEADQALPGDLRGSVRGITVQGSVLTIASLSGYATRELKRQEGYILANINAKIEGKKIERIKYLA